MHIDSSSISRWADQIIYKQQQRRAQTEQFSHFTPLRVSTQRMAERREIIHSLNAASLIDADTYIALHARLPFLLMEQEAQESRISAQAMGLTTLCFSSY